jgi:hypothetical protein
MNTAAILSSLTHTRPRDGVVVVGRAPWQDVLQSMQGIAPWKTAFMFFRYAGDIQSRHSFFAGLFMEVMERPETKAWILQRREQGGYYRAIETLCLIAIMECGGKPYTQQVRAKLMGVSLSTWKRKYKLIYRTIQETPEAWEAEVMDIIMKRLR